MNTLDKPKVFDYYEEQKRSEGFAQQSVNLQRHIDEIDNLTETPANVPEYGKYLDNELKQLLENDKTQAEEPKKEDPASAEYWGKRIMATVDRYKNPLNLARDVGITGVNLLSIPGTMTESVWARDYKSKTLHGKVLEGLVGAVNDAYRTIMPKSGIVEFPHFTEKIMEKYFSDTPESVKPYLSTTLSLALDPSVALGLPFMKTVAKGLSLYPEVDQFTSKSAMALDALRKGIYDWYTFGDMGGKVKATPKQVEGVLKDVERLNNEKAELTNKLFDYLSEGESLPSAAGKLQKAVDESGGTPEDLANILAKGIRKLLPDVEKGFMDSDVEEHLNVLVNKAASVQKHENDAQAHFKVLKEHLMANNPGLPEEINAFGERVKDMTNLDEFNETVTPDLTKALSKFLKDPDYLLNHGNADELREAFSAYAGAMRRMKEDARVIEDAFPHIKVKSPTIDKLKKALAVDGSKGFRQSLLRNIDSLSKDIDIPAMPPELRKRVKEIDDLIDQIRNTSGEHGKALRNLHNVLQKDEYLINASRAARDAWDSARYDEAKAIIGDPDGKGFVLKVDKDFDPRELIDKGWNELTDADLPPQLRLNDAVINSSEDLQFIMRKVAKTYDEMLLSKIPDESERSIIKEAADASLIELTGRTDFTTYTPGEALSLLQGFRASIYRLKTLTQNYNRPGSEMTKNLNKVAIQKSVAITRQLMSQLFPLKSHAGRLLRAFGIKSGGVRARLAEIDQMISMAKDSGFTDEFMAKFIQKLENPVSIGRLIEKSTRAKVEDSFFELFTNMILSGPLTHLKNISANAAVLAIQPTEDLLSMMWSASREVWKGDFHNTQEFAGAFLGDLHGLMGGITDTLKLIYHKGDITKLDIPVEHLTMPQQFKNVSQNIGQTIKRLQSLNPGTLNLSRQHAAKTTEFVKGLAPKIEAVISRFSEDYPAMTNRLSEFLQEFGEGSGKLFDALESFKRVHPEFTEDLNAGLSNILNNSQSIGIKEAKNFDKMIKQLQGINNQLKTKYDNYARGMMKGTREHQAIKGAYLSSKNTVDEAINYLKSFKNHLRDVDRQLTPEKIVLSLKSEIVDAIQESEKFLKKARKYPKNVAGKFQTIPAILQKAKKHLEDLSVEAAHGVIEGKSFNIQQNVQRLQDVQRYINQAQDKVESAAKYLSRQNIHLPEELLNMHELSVQNLRPSITAEEWGATGKFGDFVDLAGKYIRKPGNALLLEDKIFKMINYRMSVNRDAALKAANMKGSWDDKAKVYHMLRNNPDEHMVMQGIKKAAYFTFTNDLGKAGKDFQKVIARTPFLHFLLPFFKTPTNIVKMATRYSIFGNAVKDMKDVLRKGPKGDVARARMAMGTAIPMALLWLMGDKITGKINQRTPTGRFLAESKLEHSVTIGDTQLSYASFEPYREILDLMVAFKEIWESARDETFYKDPETGRERSVLDAAFLITISPVIDVIGENYMLPVMGQLVYLADAISHGNTEYARQIWNRTWANLTMPAFVRQINTALIDKKFRQANTYMEMLKEAIPGYSTTLQPELTFWGEERITPSGLWIGGLSPVKTKTAKYDQVDDEIERLGVRIPRDSQNMALGEDLGIVKLTHEQINKKKLMRAFPIGAKPLKEIIKNVMNSREYKDPDTSDFERRERIQYIIDAANEASKMTLLESDQDLQTKYQEAIDARKRIKNFELKHGKFVTPQGAE